MTDEARRSKPKRWGRTGAGIPTSTMGRLCPRCSAPGDEVGAGLAECTSCHRVYRHPAA